MIDLLRSYPQLVIFLAIAIGYFVGKIKVFKFNLGSTAGVLLTALVLGQIGIDIPAILKTVGFALFIFAIGYKVGPQFFGALKKEGINYLWLSLVVAITGLLTAIGLAKIFGFDAGTAAGVLAGAMTQSSVIGTADGAIKSLPITAAAKTIMQSDVAVAYAITYLFGTAGLIVFFKLVPRLIGINLKEESKKLEAEMSGGEAPLESAELFSWNKRINLRAYKATKKISVKELEGAFLGNIAVEKIKHNNQIIDPTSDAVIEIGDEIALVGHRGELLKAEKLIGPEIDDKAVINIIGEIIDVCVLKKEIVGKTLGEIHGHGCFLRKITRQGHELPLTRNIIVEKCDVLQIAGTRREVENFIKNTGYPERATATTDMSLVGIGIVFGTLIGLIAIPFLGIPITLGVGGGVLVAGLICGWLRAIHPTFGQIPTGAQWIFTDFGLNLFIACVGLSAGPRAIHALQTTGASIFIAGVILTLLPMIVGLIFGKFILRINPVLLFGALTGAGTITAALNGLKEEADSAAPALGYAAPYAFGNVLLTVWGSVLVHLIGR